MSKGQRRRKRLGLVQRDGRSRFDESAWQPESLVFDEIDGAGAEGLPPGSPRAEDDFDALGKLTATFDELTGHDLNHERPKGRRRPLRYPCATAYY